MTGTSVGITAYGAYVPMLRLPLSRLAGHRGGDRQGERAVANFDEDAITMGVAAAVDCLGDTDRDAIDGVLFASTSYPFKEKMGASIIAKALDLRRDVDTGDFGHSLRAGTIAIRSAIDAIRAGTARHILVVAADCRLAPPNTKMESNFGDGAAALLLGADSVEAVVTGRLSIADEILDVWRTDRDEYVHAWEDRFVVDRGYRDNVIKVARDLLARSGLNPAAITRAAMYAPDARSLKAAATGIGLDPSSQLQDPLFGKVGNTGAAFAPMLLASALEGSAAGDRILVVSYGDGADALILEVTDRIAGAGKRRGLGWHLKRRAELLSYEKYLRFRHLYPTAADRRAGAGLSATVHYRDGDSDISLLGHRCRRCGTLQFPFQRVCFTCYGKDDFDKVRLSDQKGKLVAFTMDNFAGSPDPPLVATMTETEQGCRLFVQMTDGNPAEVRLGLPVEFTFRKIHEAGGMPNYFWKCTPIR